MLTISKGIEIDRELPVFIGDKIGNQNRIVEKKFVGRAPHYTIFAGAGSSFTIFRPSGRRGCRSDRLTIKLISAYEFLFTCFGIADRPRVEENFGANEHVARKLLRVASLKNVAKLISQITSTDIEAGQEASGSSDEPCTLGAAKGLKRIVTRKETGCDDMNAGQGICSGDIDLHRFLVCGYS